MEIQKFIGFLVSKFLGFLVVRFLGFLLVLFFSGFLVLLASWCLCFFGLLVSWFQSSKASNFNKSFNVSSKIY